VPARPPIMQPNNPVEQPHVDLTAPYKPHPVGDPEFPTFTPALPDDFMDAPLGPDDMFKETGFEPPTQLPQPPPLFPLINTFASAPRNFGGVLANCARAITLDEQNFPPPFDLPDYNLDRDRGYAWRCWDVKPYPDGRSDPLSPDNRVNAGTAHVNAVRVVDEETKCKDEAGTAHDNAVRVVD